ncbi:TniQ family protein [Actinocrinis puniceicyclus]|uniref:TniQ family protein n=1 Tax=Actinocrinis puniceicyclus TaxID=977794 RepID=A0A8J8BC56_9ACTN|nr:TniQ family protein [Actinocrinis puniceicyclus]MBS2964777.1 TniQ family protein [Actinocrinis puniceicyclus]
MVRTFPIRIAPLPGEALDSWLEALTHRMQVRYGDVLQDLDLSARTKHKSRNPDVPNDWTIALREHEAAGIAHATGTDQSVLHRMTLMRFQGRALLIDSETRQVNRKRLWGRGSGSRYCPDCLADSGGRWQLTWRLGWSFACLRHGRLLADLCPKCMRTPRQMMFSRDGLPIPGRCGSWPSKRAEPTSGCGHELSTTRTLRLAEDHPALTAQRLVLETIDADRAVFGLYGRLPQPASVALSEVRAVAGRVLANITAPKLSAWVPLDILDADAASHDSGGDPQRKTLIRPGFMAPPTASTTAIAITAALRILGTKSRSAAARAMRELIDSCREGAEKATVTTIVTWGRGTGPVLRSIQLAALGPTLRPGDQLRMRTSAFPARERADELQLNSRARALPSVFWTAWQVRLSPPGVYSRVLAPAWAAATLLVGSGLTMNAAAAMLGSVTDLPTVSRLLQLLQERQGWDAATVALDRLADFLDESDIAIDYERRRRLDYRDLLPSTQWTGLCRTIGYPAGGELRARVARCVLFHRISALPIDAAPGFPATEQTPFRSECERFIEVRPAEIADALDAVAREFLATQGAEDEPVVWNPPIALLDGIDLPGTDPADIDIAHLHKLVQGRRYPARFAADALGSRIETIRDVLTEHPAPMAPKTATQARATGQRMRVARQLLPEHELRRRYLDEYQSAQSIGNAYGITRAMVARLAGEYGIPMRTVHHRRYDDIDREWLVEQYVELRRTPGEIAREKGTSISVILDRAHAYGIPMRPPGGGSHAAHLRKPSDQNADQGAASP